MPGGHHNIVAIPKFVSCIAVKMVVPMAVRPDKQIAGRARVPEVQITGTTMMVLGPEYAMHMPGMLTQAQLDELGAAQGAEFDRLFLIYMIQHHQGAVTMVHELFATDGAGLDGLVFKLASDIQADQTTEIARIELMLEEMTTPGREP